MSALPLSALPGASWQRCRTHYLRNLLTRVPRSAQPHVATQVRTVFDQADVMPAGPARFKVYQGAEQRLLDDGAWITLYHYASRALIRPSVTGLERSPLSTAPEFLAPLRKVRVD